MVKNRGLWGAWDTLEQKKSSALIIKMVISFAWLLSVRLLLYSMAVLYLVNG